MSHAHRREKSRHAYFRMDVPKDIQTRAGKTSWQHTLKTSDPTEADAIRARYSAFYKAEVSRLRKLAAESNRDNARDLIEKAFEKLAASFGSMDRAIAVELESVALSVRSSWSREDARAAERMILGEEAGDDWDADGAPVDVFGDARARQNFLLRSELFETRPDTAGPVHQELARALLDRADYGAVSYQVACLAFGDDRFDLSIPAQFEAVAHAYLERLASHDFTAWNDIRAALAPVMTGMSPVPTPHRLPTSVASNELSLPPSDTRTLSDAFAQWTTGKRITGDHKTADEFATAVRRFEQLTGITDIAAITPDMVRSFHRQVEQLPFRPAREIKALPLAQQIVVAREKNLSTLSPPTVGKQLAGVRAVLAAAVDAGWIATNPAAGITVADARWEGTERDHFSDDDMRLIYSSSLLTDPAACSDTMFWILFLAPFHGSRPGEHCKLKPGEVVRDGGEWLMRIRADRRPRRIDGQASATRPRRTKTRGSIRDIPVHWVVEEGGFIDFSRLQRARGVEWLFDDLVADKYGDRYKYLSREINDRLRELGITDPGKSFYSTRHTMKREGRRQRIAAQNLNQLSGHAEASVGGRYGQGVPADILKQDIDRLEFRSVEWHPVVTCARARVDRLIHRHGPIA